MSDTLIIGVITGTVALLSVGLNVFWMGKTFDQLSSALKDLTGSIDRRFDKVDKQFDKVDSRFERIEADLKQFYKLHNEQVAALQTLKDRNDLK